MTFSSCKMRCCFPVLCSKYFEGKKQNSGCTVSGNPNAKGKLSQACHHLSIRAEKGLLQMQAQLNF